MKDDVCVSENVGHQPVVFPYSPCILLAHTSSCFESLKSLYQWTNKNSNEYWMESYWIIINYEFSPAGSLSSEVTHKVSLSRQSGSVLDHRQPGLRENWEGIFHVANRWSQRRSRGVDRHRHGSIRKGEKPPDAPWFLSVELCVFHFFGDQMLLRHQV